MMNGIRQAMVSPYRFFVVAAVLAALFTMLPTQADAPETEGMLAAAPAEGGAENAAYPAQQGGVPAGADLSERTQAGAYLHRTMTYTCGHSVQRREEMPSQLVGLTHAALEMQLGQAVPSGKLTGFSAQEVDVAQQMDIPCPLHWVLQLGENGKLTVLQNMTGEALAAIKETEIAREMLSGEEMQALLNGIVFDDTQALEGYMESLSS